MNKRLALFNGHSFQRLMLAGQGKAHSSKVRRQQTPYNPYPRIFTGFANAQGTW